ncbi:TIGR04282 family arsenosugar biosynthesis glycosyltransferase [Rubrolithibacter danxiaensis]|uniref:TIGR04282 family arsenosugar biosynthesis glycosyltransferase n=1 Tax=Rubrolithibacter danxiaensis TaxID=3390805 RepID=UPI003BF9263F
MNSGNALLIFVKNSIYGKVKTRLAATAGNDLALDVYKKLVSHTFEITTSIQCNKIIFYSDFIPAAEKRPSGFDFQIQKGTDLGERMLNAMHYAFARSYTNVLIIGSDCLELETSIIIHAYKLLENNEAVIGPATDGGYYLIGLKKPFEKLFKNKNWSTQYVFNETVQECINNDITYTTLQTLSDIDTEKDLLATLQHSPHNMNVKNLTLIFVYNADSDLFSSVTDFVHKLISPSTYDCNLCALTYHNFGIKKEWKEFIESTGARFRFLHKDEFEEMYEVPADLPAVFYLSKELPKQLISASEINSCKSLDQLKSLVSARIRILEFTDV